MKIALFDSGVNDNRREIDSNRCIHKDTVRYYNDKKDNVGHGTAIAYILQKRLPSAVIVSYKLFEKDELTDENALLDALQDILDYESEINLINISSGVTFIEQYERFYDICNRLKERNCIIVSAYDNDGSISYPAGFDNTIGVYWDVHVRSNREYYFIEQSPVEILGYAGNQKLPWGKEGMQYVSGSSFATPYITAIIAQIQEEYSNITIEEIRNQLKRKAKKVYRLQPTEISEQEIKINEIKKIRKAIIYPVNKEMHALIANQDLLSFEISGVYDYRYSNTIKKTTSDIIHFCGGKEFCVKKYEDINWTDDFDTIIVGHLDIINEILDKESQKEILDNCYKYCKNCVLLDAIGDYDVVEKIREQGQFVINHKLENLYISHNVCGSYHKISAPVVAISGTSAKQGKFNVQLELRRKLLRDGYDIGQVGTEPTAHLFGMDIVFSNGYNDSYDITDEKEILYINECLFRLKDRELILVGTQSNTIPYRFGNIGFLSIHQQNVLIASEPDATILCVNADDEYEYINRTIQVLENYYMTKVIALVIYPFHKVMDWNTNLTNKAMLSTVESIALKEKMLNEFKISTYINGNPGDMETLYQKMLVFFAQDVES
ncbi:MAG: S8 family serine peptidase [Lachnospiraceae bacterium]|nr:S8 family serine peptidase [Lachnospiraceae bacterium]